MVSAIRTAARGAWRAWEKFWFEADGFRPMRLYRFLLGLLLFVAYSIRGLDLRLWFSDQGLLRRELMAWTLPMEHRYSLLSVFPSDGALWAFHFAFLACLLLVAFGVGGRVVSAIAFVLHVSFLHRNVAVMYGMDLIATFFLFYLFVAKPSGRKPAPESWNALLASVGFRFVQIQLCVIYAYSGWHKLRGIPWWKGEAIWGVIGNYQYARHDFSWVAHFPGLVIFATYSTLLWEIYFPVLVWLRKWRPWMLLFGVALHVGIAVFINIPFFAAIMMVGYCAFLGDVEIKRGFAAVKFLAPLEGRLFQADLPKFSVR